MSNLLLHTYHIVLIVATLLALYLCVGKKLCRQQHFFFLYLLLVLVVDIYEVSKFFKIQMIHGYQAFAFLSILYFSSFYYKFQKKNGKRLIVFLCLLSVALGLYFQTIDGWNMLSNYLLLTYSTLCIILSMQWLIQAMQSAGEQSLTKQFPFWVSAALLFWSVFYTVSTVARFYLYENDMALSIFMGNLLLAVNGITYLLFLMGLLALNQNK